jgi:hypothetical protein
MNVEIGTEAAQLPEKEYTNGIFDAVRAPSLISSPFSIWPAAAEDSPATLQRKPIYVFPEKALHGLSPNFHIHVSVRDLYIPRGSVRIFSCSRIGRPIVGIYKSLTDT